jgi:hypothetical protein
MHSFFFSLGDSFRDDRVKIWQSVSLFCASGAGYFALKRELRSHFFAFSGVVLLVSLYTGFMNTGPVELGLSLFVWMIALCFLARDASGELRISIYLLGLLFTKNEGLVGSAVFSFLFALPALGRSMKLRPLAPYLIVGGVWVAIMSRLPSNHERYPSHIVSVRAWAAGLPNVSHILDGWLEVMLGARQWRPLLVAFPLVLALVLASGNLRSLPAGAVAGRLAAWVSMMLVIFLSIYTVSPWGPDLYKVTFGRLVAQMFPALVVAGVALLSLLAQSFGRRGRIAGVGIQLALLAFYGASIKNDSVGAFGAYLSDFREGKTGTNAFFYDPAWKRALELDARIPTAARGAILRSEHDYFSINYLLFPRLLYPAPKETVAGTSAPWEDWKTQDELAGKSEGFEFVYDAHANSVALIHGG